MKKILRIVEYLEKQGVGLTAFERKTGLGYSYLSKTRDRGSEITQKALDKILAKAPEDFYKIFPEETEDNKKRYKANEIGSAVNEEETNEYQTMQALLKLADSNKAVADAILINVRNAEKIIMLLESKQKKDGDDESKASA